WQTYNGKPSMFGPGLTSQATSPDAQAQKAAGNDVSVPSAAAAPAQASAVPGEQTPVPTESERITVSTGVLNLTFDTQGAQLVRALLPRYKVSDEDPEPFTLLDRRPGYTYVAQTGVVGAPAGQSFPTHLTPFRYLGEQEQNGRKV